ncbi:MAG: 23S rRNA (uracil(1939)-C(5))-methyltransferase RlmD [Acidobacteria bacterium]|nr:23S rRNA (uracil(1939)-C(5))-methyltransferase RlmD [Acidobacteriota bacterium]
MIEYILASGSPRRNILLKKVIDDFSVHPSGFDESSLKIADPVEFAKQAAAAKAKEVSAAHPESIVIGADTVVSLDGTILGKPKTREEARDMLFFLSGRRHKVVTGLALYREKDQKHLTGYELTYVTFRTLTESMVKDYLDSGDYTDKAGAYAIQNMGDLFIEKIQGDYDNVVGLPVGRLRKMLGVFSLPELSVTVIDIALPSDYGVAKYEGKTYMIPGATLGAELVIRKAVRKKGVQFAETVREQAPSPFHVTPRCPHFGTCGGCVFQNLDYEKQLDIKTGHLKHTLRHIGGIDVPENLRVLPSPRRYLYRNKMEFAFGEKDGIVHLGLRERSSPLRRYKQATVPLQQCDIFSEIVSHIFPIMKEYAAAHGLKAHSTRTGTGDLRHLVLREGKNTGDVMALFVTARRDMPALDELMSRIREEVPQIKSLYWIRTDRSADVVTFEDSLLLSGPPFIEERLFDSLRFRIYPPSFFQPNVFQAERLYTKVEEFAALSGSERILGLYCGTGTMELCLAGGAAEVIGIDIVPENIQTAVENAAVNGLNNSSFISGDVGKVLKEESFEADLCLIDPPRGGIAGKAMRHLQELNPPRIIYVSCNPATLARDISLLKEGNYTLSDIAAFDMFPHTAHMEAVALLDRHITKKGKI